jgi:hypothetical protein
MATGSSRLGGGLQYRSRLASRAGWGGHVGERRRLVGEQVERVAQVDEPPLRGEVARLDRRRHVEQRPLGPRRGGEHAHEPVIVLLRDGVELVVVAARAGHRQPEQPARDRVDALVPVVGREAPDHVGRQPLILVVDGRGAEVPERPQVVAARVRHQIRRDLQLDEARVGHVGVDRLDDPVAVAPREGIRLVGRLGGRVVLAVAGDVHPVPPPALAIVGRGEQPVDERLEGARRAIGGEGPHLVVGRLEAEQVDVRALGERRPIGGRRGREALGLERGDDERVDARARPGLARRRGGDRDARRGLHGLERPPGAALLDRHPRLRGGGRGPGRAVRPRIDRARGDPPLEVRDHAVGQLARRRHLDLGIRVAQGREQPALARLAGHDDRPRAPALAQAGPGVEHEPALGGGERGGVALAARLDEHRADSSLEERYLAAVAAVARGRDVGRDGFTRRADGDRRRRRETSGDARPFANRHDPARRSRPGAPGQGTAARAEPDFSEV